MTEKKDSPLDKFYRCVDVEIVKRLKEIEDKVAALDGTEKLEAVSDLLIDANSMISLACGDDDELYECWRYRLVVEPDTQKRIIFQGDEIDINYREWMDSFAGMPTGDKDEDEEEFEDYDDDDEDWEDDEDEDGDDNPLGHLPPK